MTTLKCHICGSDNMTEWCTGLVECLVCSHVQANMCLSESELSELYGYKYFHGTEYVDYNLEKHALELNFNRRLREIQKNIPPGKRLFEIGCAYGFFLELAAKVYIAAGCDISDHAIQSAQELGLNVVCADYLSIPPPEKPYDVICMWDTIEHIAKPKDYVEKAFSELNRDGCLIITTGDAGSLVARLRREKWRMVHPPTHLHYFTMKSMSTMLENSGYNTVKIRHDPFYRNVVSSLSKAGSLTNNRILGNLYKSTSHIPGLSAVNFPLNLYDIMSVFAWKD